MLGILSVNEISKLTLRSVEDDCHAAVGQTSIPSPSLFDPSLRLTQSLPSTPSNPFTDVR